MNESDNLSSLDMAVGFFASIVVLFVFVVLTIDKGDTKNEQASVYDSVEIASAVPATWVPIAERSSFAIFNGTTFTLLDMAHFADATINVGLWSNSDSNYDRYSQSNNEPAPNAFSFTMGTILKNFPSKWIRHQVNLLPDDGSATLYASTCLLDNAEVFRSNLVTVFLASASETRLDLFLMQAELCELRYRIFVLPNVDETTGRTKLEVGLNRSVFSRTGIFR